MNETERAAGGEGDGRKPSFAGWLMAPLVLGYAVFLWRFFAPAISTPDANGYFAQGSLIAQTGRAWFSPDSPTQYVGMHWLLGDEGRYFSRYPPGLAIPVALLGRLLPMEYGALANPLFALAALIGMYGLSRVWLPAGWAVLAAALLGLNAMFARYAIAGDAHMPPAALLILGLWALARWGRDGGYGRIALAGLLLGCIPAVRYPEAIFGLGVAVFVLLHARSRRPILLHALAGAAGAAIPIGLLAARNRAAFGAFWRTAYAFTNEQTGFSWDYFRAHFTQYLRFVQSDGVGLLFAFGLAGMILLAARRETRPLGLAMALMAIPSMLLYMAYYWAPQQTATGTMRFLVPTFPLYVLAGTFALRALASAGPRAAGPVLVATTVLFQALWSAPPALDDLRRMHASNRALAAAVRGMDEHVPHGAVVMASAGLLQHLDFVRRWKLVDLGLARTDGFGGRMMDGRDDGQPRPMQAGKRQAQTEKYEGLAPLERERAFGEDVVKWAAGQPVFFVGTEPDVRDMRGALFHPDNFRVVARVPMPEMPPEPERDAGFGGFRGAGRTPRGTGDASGRLIGDLRRRFARGGMGGAMRGDFLRGEKEMIVAVWTPVARRPVAPAGEDRLDRLFDTFQPGPDGPRRR